MTAASIGKIAGALFASLVATVIATLAGELAGVALFPSDAAYIVWLPAGAKLMIVATWALAALAGAIAAVRLAERRLLAPAGAAWTLIGIVYSISLEPYPWWMIAAGLVLPPAMAALAFVAGARR